MKGKKASPLIWLLSLVMFTAVSAVPAVAHETGGDSPGHSVSAIECEYNDAADRVLSVEAFPPEQVKAWPGTGQEMVSWKPELYRWDGIRYYPWKTFEEPLAFAAATPDGLKEAKGSAWRNSDGEKFRSRLFTNLPKGSYAIVNVMSWEKHGHMHRDVSPNWCGN